MEAETVSCPVGGGDPRAGQSCKAIGGSKSGEDRWAHPAVPAAPSPPRLSLFLISSIAPIFTPPLSLSLSSLSLPPPACSVVPCCFSTCPYLLCASARLAAVRSRALLTPAPPPLLAERAVAQATLVARCTAPPPTRSPRSEPASPPSRDRSGTWRCGRLRRRALGVRPTHGLRRPLRRGCGL
jgi:hypothetical protein